jgi:hypothetical protein
MRPDLARLTSGGPPGKNAAAAPLFAKICVGRDIPSEGNILT